MLHLCCCAGPSGQVVSGRLPKAHLSDHPAAVGALVDVLKAGMQLSGLMVLERLEHKGTLVSVPPPCAAHTAE